MLMFLTPLFFQMPLRHYAHAVDAFFIFFRLHCYFFTATLHAASVAPYSFFSADAAAFFFSPTICHDAATAPVREKRKFDDDSLPVFAAREVTPEPASPTTRRHDVCRVISLR